MHTNTCIHIYIYIYIANQKRGRRIEMFLNNAMGNRMADHGNHTRPLKAAIGHKRSPAGNISQFLRTGLRPLIRISRLTNAFRTSIKATFLQEMNAV